MPTAYSYVRFSTPDQAKGDSLRRQLARSQRFAEERGLDSDDSLRDLGTSAFHNRHADTGHLAGFLTLVREGKIEPGSFFLVESLDRLSRDEFWPAFDLIRDLLRAKVHIVTLPADDDARECSLASTDEESRFDKRNHLRSDAVAPQVEDQVGSGAPRRRRSNALLPGRAR